MAGDGAAVEGSDHQRVQSRRTGAQQVFRSARGCPHFGADGDSAGPASNQMVFRADRDVSDAGRGCQCGSLWELTASVRVDAFAADAQGDERNRNADVEVIENAIVGDERRHARASAKRQRLHVEGLWLVAELAGGGDKRPIPQIPPVDAGKTRNLVIESERP